MQTAPAGTYSGVLHCAGGILKGEGPLAFYKASLSVLLPSHGVSPRVLGNPDTVARDRSVCFDPICWAGVLEAIIFRPEHRLGHR
jgi:hypothetical protein